MVLRAELWLPCQRELQMEETRTQTLRFFSLEGRIGRLRYLAYGIGVALICIIPAILGWTLLAAHQVALGWVVLGVVYLFIVVMDVAFTIRRLHDMNASGWWALILLVQFVVSLILTPISSLIGLIFSLVLLFTPGTGENRFGASPPPNSVWTSAATVVVIPLGIGILAAIAIPQYQDYVARAQMAEAIELSDAARHQVHQYFIQNKQWPQSLVTVYAPATNLTSVGRYVASLYSILSPDGAYGIIATMKTDETVNFGIRGKALEMWTRDGGKSWWCGPASANPMDVKFVPAVCRDTTDARP